MQLKYVVNGIGVYIDESDNESWNALIADWLQKELDSSLCDAGEERVEQKLLIKPYSLLNNGTLCQGFVTPNYSVYENGLFLSLELKMAVKAEKGFLTIWIDEEYLNDVIDAFVLPFFLQLLFAERNMTFVHAVGIVVDGKGILLPALPGMHKTAFISAAMKVEGIKMLGDELVLIDKDGYLYPYPGHCWLTIEHKPFFPEYKGDYLPGARL